MLIESGRSPEDLKLNAADLFCFIVLRFADTPIVITPLLLMLLAPKGVSPSKRKRSLSLISFVVTLTRWNRGGIKTRGSGGFIVSPIRIIIDESLASRTGYI